MISLSHPSKIINTSVKLPASKSISNRVLIIHYLMGKSFQIDNLSNCNDTVDLVNALQQIAHYEPSSISEINTIDVGEAGTSYRFLTALLATLPGKYMLKGSDKLMHRPITNLIKALNNLGANIKHVHGDENGPLLISGTLLEGGTINMNASTSSQFISALLLVAPYFKNGLTIHLEDKIVSLSYIKMTVELMKVFGATVILDDKTIQVKYGPYQVDFTTYTIESDWTAASYWYAFGTVSSQCNILLQGLYEQSLQGDKIVSSLFNIYGIQSKFDKEGVTLTKVNTNGFLEVFDFNDNPDLVQTFVFMNAALGLPLQVNNASNLVHKETNRIEALGNEIKKIGVTLKINTGDDFRIESNQPQMMESAIFDTYQDHRMAMAAAILAMLFKKVTIADEHVVSKSYPAYWQHLLEAGFKIEGLK